MAQDLQENIPLLYFWYADMEIAMSTSSSNSELSSQRAIHILSCLGGNAKYTPFSGQPSPVQILRARQGFKELIKSLRPMCARGSIGEESLAIICAASLFEILTNDWFAGIQVIEEAFSMVLPGYSSTIIFCFFIQLHISFFGIIMFYHIISICLGGPEFFITC